MLERLVQIGFIARKAILQLVRKQRKHNVDDNEYEDDDSAQQKPEPHPPTPTTTNNNEYRWVRAFPAVSEREET